MDYEVMDGVKPRYRHVCIVVIVVVVVVVAAAAVVVVIVIIIIIMITVITDRDAVVDGIFLAVHVQFRFADINTFATDLRFTLQCSLQTNSHFRYGTRTHLGQLLWCEITATGI